MKIGIIGTGNMGTALGTAWARAGHEVLFGSRDDAKAQKVARGAAPSAKGGSVGDAAAFGDVVLYTLRDVLPTKLLDGAHALDGKVVVDCNNSDFIDAARGTFPVARPGESFAEKIAQDIPKARVVKAFNTHPAAVLAIAPDVLRAQHVSAFVSGNDPAARAIVCGLASDIGLVPLDSGELDRAYLIEGLADFLRFQIVRGLGTYATLSITVVKEKSDV